MCMPIEANFSKEEKGSPCVGPRKRFAAERHLLLMQEPHVKLVRAVWVELELEVLAGSLQSPLKVYHLHFIKQT